MTILKNMISGRSRTFLNPAQRSEPASARAAAIPWLARRDYARAELAAKLRAAGFEEQACVAAIGDLTREGVLDDDRFAANYVGYHAKRGQGPQRIAAALRQRGLADALIEEALARADDWTALARKARTARFGARPPASWAEKAKQARFLQYRGFSADHIRAATGADSDMD
jgi:regulatory protein